MRTLVRRAVVVAAAVVAVAVPAVAASAAQTPATSWSPTTSPGTYDYGTVNVGHTVSQTFTLTNSGGSATSALRITVTGSAAFTMTADSCAGSLGPRKFCTVTVSYSPSASGQTDSGTLTATAHKAAATASLSLHGAAPAPLTCTLTANKFTLSGGNNPTGTVSFYATGGPRGYIYDGGTVNVNGDGTYTEPTPTAGNPGAAYSGDASNPSCTAGAPLP